MITLSNKRYLSFLNLEKIAIIIPKKWFCKEYQKVTPKIAALKMIFFSVLAIIAVVVICGLYFVIINDIVDFQIDHINPIDISATLEKYIKPVIGIHVGITFACMFDLYHNWPPLIINAIIAAFFLKKIQKRRYFEPLTIVRDANAHKYTFITCLVFTVLCFIYLTTTTIIAALS